MTDTTTRAIRLALRTHRTAMVIWPLIAATYTLVTSLALDALYATAASRHAYALTAGLPTPERIFNGPGWALDTRGGIAVYEAGGYLLPVAAIIVVLVTARASRGEEEAGLTELVRAGVGNRWAPVLAAGVVAAILSGGLGAAAALGFAASGLAVLGSLSYGAGVALTGLTFGALTLLTAQLATTGRTAAGLSGCLLAVAFVVRGAGDYRGTQISLASPLGLAQGLRPFAGEQWWPAAVLALLAAGLGGGAAALASRRDLGAGILSPRPGPARAGRALTTAPGLLWRAQRTPILAWAGGLLTLATALGIVGAGVVAATGTSQSSAVPWSGSDALAGYLTFCAQVLAVVSAAAGVSLALRLRADERNGLLEAVMAGHVSRSRYLCWHGALAGAGAAAITVSCGAGLALGQAAAQSNSSLSPWDTFAATVAYLPAVWCLVAVALVVAAVPVSNALAWLAMGYCMVVTVLGAILRWPAWAQAISPFDHIPQLPAESAADPALAVLTTLALSGLALAAAAFRRRDIPHAGPVHHAKRPTAAIPAS